jgi:hypothetical protein
MMSSDSRFALPSTVVNYTEVGSIDLSILPDKSTLDIYFDKTNEQTLLTSLMVYDNGLIHTQEYVSPLEFSTTAMKQVLTMYVKRRVTSLDPNYYTQDDPKLHGFISKLSYEGIKYVADHVVEFAKAFKENKVSEVLNIPKPSKKHRS